MPKRPFNCVELYNSNQGSRACVLYLSKGIHVLGNNQYFLCLSELWPELVFYYVDTWETDKWIIVGEVYNVTTKWPQTNHWVVLLTSISSSVYKVKCSAIILLLRYSLFRWPQRSQVWPSHLHMCKMLIWYLKNPLWAVLQIFQRFI